MAAFPDMHDEIEKRIRDVEIVNAVITKELQGINLTLGRMEKILSTYMVIENAANKAHDRIDALKKEAKADKDALLVHIVRLQNRMNYATGAATILWALALIFLTYYLGIK